MPTCYLLANRNESLPQRNEMPTPLLTVRISLAREGSAEARMVSPRPPKYSLPNILIISKARFTSNPHVVQPTSKDYGIQLGSPNATFPSPLPRYLQNSQTPTTHLPPLPDPSSSKAGQFTLALKGVRKELRRSGPRAERLVKDVEDGQQVLNF